MCVYHAELKGYLLLTYVFIYLKTSRHCPFSCTVWIPVYCRRIHFTSRNA